MLQLLQYSKKFSLNKGIVLEITAPSYIPQLGDATAFPAGDVDVSAEDAHR